MIKAATSNGVLIVGLDEENMTRLVDGKPIVFDLRDVGLPSRPVIVFGGRTLDEVRGQIEQMFGVLPYTCPKCQATSFHPEDARHGYCGRCHEFTGETTTRRPG